MLSCALPADGRIGKTMWPNLDFSVVFMLELSVKCIGISIRGPKAGAHTGNSQGVSLRDILSRAAASRAVGDWRLLSFVEVVSHWFSAKSYQENS